uniref:Fungal-type protein kinase domain-containing protein n=1 Tax=Schizophyllum commune (strain H4-8 / FGSC 9210) TaxID=578458 RepID=D8QID6_SCHCM
MLALGVFNVLALVAGHTILNTSAHPSESEADLLVYSGAYVHLQDCTRYATEYHLAFDIFDSAVVDGSLVPGTTEKGSDVLKQVFAHLESMHNRQHRLFSLFLFVNAEYFRVIRIDRDGCIASDKRLWQNTDKFHPLDDFLHLFDHLSLEEQGLDTTVREVPQEDTVLEARARAALESYVPPHKREGPILGMKVPIDAEAKSGWRSFYVWAPERDACGICTRATLSCPAWCPRENKVFFLKDSWRPLHAEHEADVIRQLNENGVRYSPTLVCGGDLPDQQTVTHLYIVHKHNVGQDTKCRPRVHHRLLEHFYRPLWEFKSSKHLLHILDNACTCHRDAVEKCQKLHRDLSFRNIMWDDETQEGILVDWDRCAQTPTPVDMAKDPCLNPLAELPRKSSRSERTGTWPFMSSMLLKTPGKLHTVQDDLESLFWVALYIILLYFPCGDIDVVPMIDRIFYEIETDDGTARGGSKKYDFLLARGFAAFFDLPDSVSEPLAIWLSMYCGMLNDWVQHHTSLLALREQLTALEKKHGKGVDRWGRSARLRKALAEIERARPDLRGYEELQNQWKAIVEQGEEEGLFIENDRFNDDVHQHPPEYVLKIYRARRAVATEQKRFDNARANQQAIAVRRQGSSKQLAQGVRRKRDSDEPQTGSLRSTMRLSLGQSVGLGEGDADDARRRPTKRPRRPAQSDSGGEAKGKERRTGD